MNWLDRIIPPKIKGKLSDKSSVPEGLWRRCKGCKAMLYATELDKYFGICPKCNHHHRIDATTRLESFLDKDSYTLIGEDITTVDALKFKDLKKYKDRLIDAGKTSRSSEALVAADGKLNGQAIVVAVFDFSFMGGSMGAVVGERFVRAVQVALQDKKPFICFSASGGARMQEGLFSLMQLSKTVAALKQLKNNSIPYISVLTDPTMGGVSASFAMLGDVIVAEPNALVGFAGPRVIEQTVRETLPEGFQRAEFLLEHGAIDDVVSRHELRQKLGSILDVIYFSQQKLSQTA